MKIAIVGCGVIGLTTGILLRQKKHDVTIYAEKNPNTKPMGTACAITSNAACAIWLPIWTANKEDVTNDYAEKLKDWSIKSWNKFCELEKEDGERYGIHWKRNHELFKPGDDEINQPLGYLLDILPEFEASYDASLPEGFNYRWSFKTLVIETPIYMRILFNDFLKLGGRVQERDFSSIEDVYMLSENIIFNCSGLGSRTLFSDNSLNGVKGQLVLHEPVDLPFAFGAGDYCLIPRTDHLILGSLRQKDYTSEEATQENVDDLFSNIFRLCETQGTVISLPKGLLSKDKIRGTLSGIRPSRSAGIRIEVENLQDKYIIHDYGHGGGGVTLSWGCALNAVELLSMF